VMRIKRPLSILAIATLSFVLTSACGAKKNEGEGLAVATQPGNEVLMGPGPASSCLDKVNTKTTGAAVTRSVIGPVIVFNNFQIQWSSPDVLYVQEIKWSIDGVGVHDGHFQNSLGPDEIEALIGLDGATFNGVTAIINSNDSTRNGTAKYAPCGLTLGNIQLQNGIKQEPFKARITIEVIGTAEDGQGNQRFVRQRILTTARFEGI
jgi:hypothetical protein